MEISSERIKKSIAVIAYCTAIEFLIGITGCSTTQHIETSCEKPVVQKSLTTECKPLPTLENKVYTEGEVVDFLSVWISMYKECRFKHSALAKFVENYSSEKP